MANYTPEELANLAKLMADNAKIVDDLTKRTQELTDAIKANIDVSKNRAELLEKSSQLEALQLQQAEATLKLLSQENNQREKALTQLQEQYSANLDIIQSIEDKIKITEQELQNLKAKAALTSEDIEKQEKLEQILERYNKAIEENIKKNDNIRDSYLKLDEMQYAILDGKEELLKKEAEEVISKYKLTEATKSLTASMTQNLQSAAGINTQYSGLVSTALKAGGGIGFMNVALKASVGAFMELFNPVNILSSAIAFAIANFQSFYNLLGDINRTLGTTTREAFLGASGYGRSLGMSLQQQQSTVDSLSKAYVDLNNKTAYHSAEIMRASYLMQKYGVDTNSATTILSAFDNSLGMSAEQSAELSNQLITTARSLGLATDAVNQLAKNMESLVVYGSRTDAVMKNVLEVSAKYGIAADSVMKMSDKLNTLSAASEANAVIMRELGQSINPLELMRADPAQKMEMLAKAIKDSGFQGEQAKYKIMALSQTLGFSNSEIEKLTKNVNGMNEGMGWMEQQVRSLDLWFQQMTGGRTLDGLEQLKVFIEKVSRPLMFLLGALNMVLGVMFGVINVITDFADKIPYIGTAIGGVVAAFIAYAIYAKGASLVTKLFGSSIRTALTEAGAGVAAFMTEVSGAAAGLGEAIPFVLMFAAAILMVGIGVGLAAAGIALIFIGVSKLVEQLGKLSGERMFAVVVSIGLLTGALYGLAAGLMALDNPASVIGFGILAGIALAFLAIGFSVKMASEGIGKMFEGIGSLIAAVAELAKALKDINGLSFDASIGTVISSMVEPFTGPNIPDNLEMKVKAVAQLPSTLKEYAEAITQFSAAGGAANAQVMVESFKEAVTTITNTVNNTTTQAPVVGESNNRFDLYLDEQYFGYIVRQHAYNVPSNGPIGGQGGR